MFPHLRAGVSPGARHAGLGAGRSRSVSRSTTRAPSAATGRPWAARPARDGLPKSRL